MDISLDQVLFFVVLIPSVILHEVTHGWVALRFGDPTAREAGRLTLNPIPHVDLFGTILLPAFLAFTTGTVFGYAKPVPVQPGRMRRPRDHGLITSLAGPGMNIALALAAGLVIRFLGPDRILRASVEGAVWVRVLVAVGVVNVVLAAFNLIPLPPLDGSAVVERFLPRRWLGPWHKLRRYSMLIVLGAVLLLPGALSAVFRAALRVWALIL
ncbi:MAG: site-2 protease family protein [Nitriliruptorales bacterium]|nr:site-2 protease family protein [Nitriliruptorales bacterium]